MSETAPVRFIRAIDRYIDDQCAEGRINSPHTEREYRYVLGRHADDVDNRDPAYTNREDCKRTLKAPLDPGQLLRLDGRGGVAAEQPGPADEAAEAPPAAALPAHPR